MPPIFDISNKKFITLASVESMVPYYGRHGTKPIRWGYKGYQPFYQTNTNNIGLGGSVVLQFADSIEKFFLYFDNFVTSFKLLEELNSRGLKGTETIRENKIAKDCRMLQSFILKKKERGLLDIFKSLGLEWFRSQARQNRCNSLDSSVQALRKKFRL
ncbi:hypothetical protein ILUMI_02589 [Ignelater luminosus]|uniref:Uncharacterized protein n=1 Tax=Ignelater luminosus TaxID=2038154 RepID=A0A8K0DNH4_IGNLU|nr:hypothetical protein ILUMI_02589 [Ignelater luminosus]